MAVTALDLDCENGHKLYLASYRNSSTLKRIPGLLYCPDCNEFYQAKSQKIQVTIK